MGRHDNILAAMRADGIQPGVSGRWQVAKSTFGEREVRRAAIEFADKIPLPPGVYTHLFCYTWDTMNNKHGETVMNDFPSELAKHLQFILTARGRVLVGGLGLGCVVRGLLANGKVEMIDVVERSASVIKLCGHSVADPLVNIIQADLLVDKIDGGPWDYAWWDLWNDPDKDEPHLQLIHLNTVAKFVKRVKVLQGCWALPRSNRRRLRDVVM